MIELANLDFAVLLTLKGLIALLTLTALEIVLGIDNIIFISILSNSLNNADDQRKARKLGLALAMITRIILLVSLSWIMGMDKPLFAVLDEPVSGRDIVLVMGGLFLLYKATVEIRAKVEGLDEEEHGKRRKLTLMGVVVQIVLIDIVFSIDSVITAVGMSNELLIMILAVMIAVGVMMFAAGSIASFVDRHATVKVLALAFLVMIGVALLMEGTGGHLNKNYIYFAMAFSVGVEMLNLRMMRRRLLRGVRPPVAGRPSGQ